MATTELTESDLGLLNELKVDLVHRITEIDDLETIKEVFVCLQQHAPKKPYVLSPEEEKIVEERHREMAGGVGIPHADVCKKAEQWFQQRSR